MFLSKKYDIIIYIYLINKIYMSLNSIKTITEPVTKNNLDLNNKIEDIKKIFNKIEKDWFFEWFSSTSKKEIINKWFWVNNLTVWNKEWIINLMINQLKDV